MAESDPIGERGGVNLYEFVSNNGITRYDAKGLRPESVDYNSDRETETFLALNQHYRVVAQKFPERKDELTSMIDTLSNSDLPAKCKCYKIRMSSNLRFAKLVMELSSEAISNGKIHVYTGSRDGAYGYSTQQWGNYTGNIYIDTTEVWSAMEDGDWKIVEDTIFHEITHVGALTRDDDSRDLGYNAYRLEFLNKSTASFIEDIHTAVNSKLPSAKKCWDEKWWE